MRLPSLKKSGRSGSGRSRTRGPPRPSAGRVGRPPLCTHQRAPGARLHHTICLIFSQYYTFPWGCEGRVSPVTPHDPFARGTVRRGWVGSLGVPRIFTRRGPARARGASASTPTPRPARPEGSCSFPPSLGTIGHRTAAPGGEDPCPDQAPGLYFFRVVPPPSPGGGTRPGGPGPHKTGCFRGGWCQGPRECDPDCPGYFMKEAIHA